MDSNAPAIFVFAPRTLAVFLHDLMVVDWTRLDVESAESLVVIDGEDFRVIGAPRRVERDGRDWMVRL